MNGKLEHSDVRELIALAALDALSPSDRSAFETHLATCAECASELAAMRDAAASVGASVPQLAMSGEASAQMRARLVARARGDSSGITPIGAAPSRQAPLANTITRRRTPWLAAAALLLAAAASYYGITEHGNATALATQLAQLRDTNSTMAKKLDDQLALMQSLTGPGVRVIDASATSASQPYARMFWDQPTNKWTFVAYNLPATTAGHTYQLWLVTRDSKKIPAGTFDPSSGGTAFVRATYALARDSLAAIAVTNEPTGGSAQPTTTPFLVGAVKTD